MTDSNIPVKHHVKNDIYRTFIATIHYNVEIDFEEITNRCARLHLRRIDLTGKYSVLLCRELGKGTLKS